LGSVPIYEYQCADCGKVFEAFQKISDAPLAECRFCNGRVDQLISKTSFQLKGGGWYVTDYARPSANSAADAPKSDSAEKTPESKSESAPKSSEKKSDSKTNTD
jgi:putative FmdB family regulatory protein